MSSFGTAASLYDEFKVDRDEMQCGLLFLPQLYSGMQEVQSRLLDAAENLEIVKVVLPDERNTYKTDAEV